MENYNFEDELKAAEKAFNIGKGDTFKFQEGDNRIRVLSPGKPVATHRISQKEYHTCYGEDKGCPFHGDNEKQTSVKFLMWIIDRRDGKVKLAFMPYTIMKNLVTLQNDPDYRFSAPPLPYDITVNAQKAGTKEVTYTVLPKKEEPLTVDEEREFADQKPVDEVIERLKKKEMKGEEDEE
jgi:hypothetical protein